LPKEKAKAELSSITIYCHRCGRKMIVLKTSIKDNKFYYSNSGTSWIQEVYKAKLICPTFLPWHSKSKYDYTNENGWYFNGIWHFIGG